MDSIAANLLDGGRGWGKGKGKGKGKAKGKGKGKADGRGKGKVKGRNKDAGKGKDADKGPEEGHGKNQTQQWQRMHEDAVGMLSDGHALGQVELDRLDSMRRLASQQQQQNQPKGSRRSPPSPYVPYPSIGDPAFAEKLLTKREFRENATPVRPSVIPMAACNSPAASTTAASASASASFDLTPVQRVVRTYVGPGTPYNGMLLFHGVGVGKTCAAVSVAEQYVGGGGSGAAGAAAGSGSGNRLRNGVIVLARPGLHENFRRTVFSMAKVARRADGTPDWDGPSAQCTGNAYTDLVPDRHRLTVEQVEARVARIVRSRYTFMGLLAFANLVDSLASAPGVSPAVANERLRQRFSDCVLIVDEAHNLREPAGGKGGRAPPGAPAVSPGVTPGLSPGDANKKGSKKVTPQLMRVLRCTENVKLLLLTATPMFNRAADIVDLLNLLLVNDKRPRISPSEVFADGGKGALIEPRGAETIRAACKGYVSYASGGDPFTFPLRLPPSASGDPLVLRRFPLRDLKGASAATSGASGASAGAVPSFGFEVVGTPMGEAQREVYMEAERRLRDGGDIEAVGDLDDEEEEEIEEGAEEAGAKGGPGANVASAMGLGMEVGNVAYPAGQHNPSIKNRTGSSIGGFRAGKTGFDGAFRAVRNARPVQFEYRPGVPEFLRMRPDGLARHAPKVETVVRRILGCEGVALVYSRFIWSGIVPVAMALEHEGFTRFEAPPLLANTQGTPGGPKGAPEGRTYAIISGNRDVASDDARALAALTSPANRDGALVRVVLISDRGSEGIDLKHVREVHVLEPWYHINKVEQVVGRAARFCSHAALPPERRNLTVYLHAAVRPVGPSAPSGTARGGRKGDRGGHPRGGAKGSALNGAKGSAPGWGDDPEVETIDLRAYRIADQKRRFMRPVERILREGAVDCGLHAAGEAARDAAAARTRVDVRTSQGRVLRAVPLSGYESPLSPKAKSTTCDTPLPGSSRGDESTYDVEVHGRDLVARYRAVASRFFVDTGRVAFTFSELSEFVQVAQAAPGSPGRPEGAPGSPGRPEGAQASPVDAVALSIALDQLVASGSIVPGPQGPRGPSDQQQLLGRIEHVGPRYVFQPADRQGDSEVLADWERGATLEARGLAGPRSVALPSPADDTASQTSPTSQTSRSSPTPPTTPTPSKGPSATSRASRANAQGLRRSASVSAFDAAYDVSQQKKLKDPRQHQPSSAAATCVELAALLLTRLGLPARRFQDAALDFVVDRQPHAVLVDLCVETFGKSLIKRSEGSNKGSIGRVRASLVGSGVLRALKGGGDAVAEVRTPFARRPVLLCRDGGGAGGQVRPCAPDGPDVPRGPAANHRGPRLLPKGTVGAMVAPSGRGGKDAGRGATFKVLDTVVAKDSPASPGIREPVLLNPSGRGSGCVCHQSAVLTVARLQELTRGVPVSVSVPDISEAIKGMDKRTLCELYEVLMREARPGSVARLMI